MKTQLPSQKKDCVCGYGKLIQLEHRVSSQMSCIHKGKILQRAFSFSGSCQPPPSPVPESLEDFLLWATTFRPCTHPALEQRRDAR